MTPATGSEWIAVQGPCVGREVRILGVRGRIVNMRRLTDGRWSQCSRVLFFKLYRMTQGG